MRVGVEVGLLFRQASRSDDACPLQDLLAAENVRISDRMMQDVRLQYRTYIGKKNPMLDYTQCSMPGYFEKQRGKKSKNGRGGPEASRVVYTYK